MNILIVLKIVEILKWVGLHELILVSDVVLGLVWIGSDVFNVLVDVVLCPVDIVLVQESSVVIYPANSVVILGPLLLLLVHLGFFDVSFWEISIVTSYGSRVDLGLQLLCIDETWRFIAGDAFFLSVLTLQRFLAKLLEEPPLVFDLL